MLVGLAIAIHAIEPLNPSIVGPLIENLGWSGMLAYVLYSLSVFVLLGTAWLLVMGERWRYLPAFVWARLLREAAADLLPFSQIGGIVVGADSLIARGLSGASVYAAMTADLTTEMVSQALFTMLGIGVLALGWTGMTSTPLLSLIAISLAVIAAITFVARSAPTWIPTIAPIVLARSAPRALQIVNDMSFRLGEMYARRARMVRIDRTEFHRLDAERDRRLDRLALDRLGHSLDARAVARSDHLRASQRGVHGTGRHRRPGSGLRAGRSPVRLADRIRADHRPRQALQGSGDRIAHVDRLADDSDTRPRGRDETLEISTFDV